MKNTWMHIATLALLASSTLTGCDVSSSRTYLGTMAGAEIGGVVGEALGWMSTDRHSGPGKAMLGSVIGTVAGAAIGNAVAREHESNTVRVGRSNKKEKRGRDDYEYNHRNNNYDYTDQGYQTGGGYYDQPATGNGYYTSSDLVISNLNYQDEDGDGRFSRNETVNIIYEVKNTGRRRVDDVVLKVEAEDNSRCFALSPSTTVSIGPGEAVRYKAKAFCKSKPSASVARFKVSATSNTAGNAFDMLQIKMNK